MNYQPKVIDLSDVELPQEVIQLSEIIAEYTHDVWAAGRLKEGWVYGPFRDDSKRTHPCLVPYMNLPESEKEYDRNTSLESLRLICSMGYKIIK